jgi:hypothetical protein
MVVAVFAFSSVSFAASNSAGNTGGAAAPKNKKQQKGYMLVFSQGGTYENALIAASGLSGKVSCGGTISASHPKVSLTLSKANIKTGVAKPKLLSCTASDSGEYLVAYANNKDFTHSIPIIAKVQPGACTYIHPNPAQNYTQAGTCDKSLPDHNQPMAPSVRVLPELTTSKKNLQGYVEIAAPGVDMNRAMCRGKVTVTYTAQSADASGGVATPKAKSAALSLVKAKGSTNNGYCAAKLPKISGKTPHGPYAISASFGGNQYLTGIYSTNTVTFPDAPVKKKH